jgi:hypothetical protein
MSVLSPMNDGMALTVFDLHRLFPSIAETLDGALRPETSSEVRMRFANLVFWIAGGGGYCPRGTLTVIGQQW